MPARSKKGRDARFEKGLEHKRKEISLTSPASNVAYRRPDAPVQGTWEKSTPLPSQPVTGPQAFRPTSASSQACHVRLVGDSLPTPSGVIQTNS